jgi:hypothetical protein
MIFVCEAKYSIKSKQKPDDENYDSFGKIIERISAKDFFEAQDEFESSLEFWSAGSHPRWRGYEITKVALDD